MPKLKNVSYYQIEAVKDDGSLVVFAPGEVKEINEQYGYVASTPEESKSGKFTRQVEILVSRFLSRYPELERLPDEPILKDVAEKSDTNCAVCGFVAKSKFGLISHMKSHKNIGK
jgi:hypothetical protein